MMKPSFSNNTSSISSNERKSRIRRFFPFCWCCDGSRSSSLQPGFATKHQQSSPAENCASGAVHLPRKSLSRIWRRSNSPLQPSVKPRKKIISLGFLRTTPNDGRKPRSQTVTGTFQKCRRDNRNFGHISDFSTAEDRVRLYFAGHGRTVDVSEPLPLKVFLDSMSFLLTQVGVPVNLTTKNYVKEISYAMGILQYPGSMRTSWLKKVYSFPDAKAMLTWLVDLLESSRLDLLEDELVREDYGFGVLRVKDYFDFFVTAHTKWKRSQTEEEVIQEFKDKLTHAFFSDPALPSKPILQARIESLSAKCEHNKELTKKKKDLEKSLNILERDIAKCKTRLENTLKLGSKLDNQIAALVQKNGKSETKLANIQRLNENMWKPVACEDKLLEHSTTFHERLRLQGRIWLQKQRILLLKEYNFWTNRDYILGLLDVNKNIRYFNNLLHMNSCTLPELHALRIRSCAQNETAYKEETEKIDKTLSSLHNEICSTHLADLKDSASSMKLEIKQVTKSINSLRQNISKAKKSNRFLGFRISILNVCMLRDEAILEKEEEDIRHNVDMHLNKEPFTAEESIAKLYALGYAWGEPFRISFNNKMNEIARSIGIQVKTSPVQKKEPLKKPIVRKEAQRSARTGTRKRYSIEILSEQTVRTGTWNNYSVLVLKKSVEKNVQRSAGIGTRKTYSVELSAILFKRLFECSVKMKRWRIGYNVSAKCRLSRVKSVPSHH